MTPGFLVLRDLLENFGKTFSQRSRATVYISVRHEFEPETTDIASKIATQRDYEYLVSVSAVFRGRIVLPVCDRAKPFLSRFACKFLGRWQPDVCHEAAAEMSLSDKGYE